MYIQEFLDGFVLLIIKIIVAGIALFALQRSLIVTSTKTGRYSLLFYLTKAKAKMGSAISQFELGFMYDEGIGVAQSDINALSWYQKSAQQGYAKAQYNLGNLYREGRGVEQSYATAKKWYQKAAELGDALSHYNLGLLYYHGYGVEQSNDKAFQYFHRAAVEDVAKAQYYLAYCYYFHTENPEDFYPTALQWFNKAAEKNDDNALYYLGVMHQKGHGVQQSYVRALESYRQSAAQGNALAKYRLYEFYMQGKGVEKDEVSALRWLKDSAENHCPEAQYALSVLYQKGDCVEQNAKTAFNWLKLAGENDYPKAQYQLSFLYESGDIVQRNQFLAAQWCSAAANNGYAKAIERREKLHDKIESLDYFCMDGIVATREKAFEELRHLKEAYFTEKTLPKWALEHLNNPLLKPYKQSIITAALPIAEIHLQEKKRLKSWVSKAGGTPYLPIGSDYPCHPDGAPLTFIFQVNFSEMPPLPNYPTQGILQFFLDCRDEDWAVSNIYSSEQIGFRTVYYEKVVEKSRHLVKDFSDYHSDAKYKPYHSEYKATFSAGVSFMGTGEGEGFFALRHDDGTILTNSNTSNEFTGAYSALEKSRSSYISGYNRICQFDFRVAPCIPTSLESFEFNRRLVDYVLLLRLFFDHLGVRYISFYIHPDDLQCRDFSKVVYYYDND